MLYVVRLLSIVFLLLVIQSTWLAGIRVFGIAPDLFLGPVFVVSLQRGRAWGIWFAFALGLLLDLEQPTRLGISSLAYILAVLALDRGARALDRTSPVVLLVLFGVCALLSEVIRGLWLGGGDAVHTLAILGRVSIPSALYTTVVVPAASWGLARLTGTKTWVLHAS
ncbi:MAG: rod shape-determining protein MreD [Candidatus Eisenbacteria bacterium]